MVVAAIVFLCFLFLVADIFLFGTIFVTITILALGTFRLLLVVVPGPVFLVFIDLVLVEDLLGPPALPVGSLALVIELGLLLLGIFDLVLVIELGLLQLEGFGPVFIVQLRLLLFVMFGLILFVVLGLLGLLRFPPDMLIVLIRALPLQGREAVARIGKVDQVLANILVLVGDRAVVPSSPKYVLDMMMLSR